ncbi:hypothetical protein RhiirA5_423447 [Rhizophagus irregularis]|uniref:Transposase Tc1-like domain-containing protein n=1 Tax=Rhizophagus irregularis TaxID=588596 RepID=A0A2I1EGX5_9GLOM|nr:hypothetical protein RhiirA5_423447 [Rhizophagus irregularis]PKC63316.1 hypothetical protein RhiirA1_463933 [Rhizophagus irregularis]PKY21378.1 hypothetical protein RhiirB3_434947 [Rhizophagus irregularis]CAB5351869.1 unnamed protein product [Rhizophagus irregularis]
MVNECSTAVDVQKSLKVNEKIEVSANTIRRTLKRNGLNSRTVEDWKKVIWSDESKFQIFGSDGCFIYLSVGYLIQIEEGLDGDLYRQILNDEFLNTLEFYELNAQDIIFQQDNDLKHTAKLT